LPAEIKTRKMIKRLQQTALLFVFGFITAIGAAQDFQWVSPVSIDEGETPNQFTTCVSTLSDGNILFTALQLAKTGGYGDVLLQKMDAEGNILSEVVLYGEGKPPVKVAADDDNNLYFTLLYTDDMSWGGDTLKAVGSQTNQALLKLDSAFRLVWVHYLDEQLSNNEHTPLCIEDGLIYTSLQKSWDITTIQIRDTNGALLDEIDQENTGFLTSIDVDTAGNIYAVGSCTTADAIFNGDAWPPPPFAYNFYVVKYDASYTPLWVKYLEDVTCIDVEVEVSDENHIYLSGMLTTAKDFDDIHLDGPSWVFDFFVSRLNSEGDFLWAREVPDVLTGDASLATLNIGNLSFMSSDADHNVYLAGMIRGTIDWGNGIITESTDNYYDILTWSYNADGEMQYAVSAGGIGWDYGHSISVSNDGEIYLSGIGTQTVTFGDIVIEEEGIFSFVSRFGYDPTFVEQKSFANDLHIYPNPATTYFTLHQEATSVLDIYNMQGQNVLQQALNAGSNRVDVSALPHGLYFTVVSGSNQYQSGKMIKR